MTDNQLALFDYGTLDAKSKNIVQREDKAFDRNMADAGTSFILACHNLYLIHEVLQYKRPGFVDYCRSKQGLSNGTAYRMLDVAAKFPNLGNIAVAPSALYALAAPSTPDAAREEALERAGNGESISHATARAIVEEHRQEVYSVQRQGRPRPEPLPFRTESEPDGDGFVSEEEDEVKELLDGQADAVATAATISAIGTSFEHIGQGTEAVGETGKAMTIHFSSATPEHYTPRLILDAAIDCMGAIDLDPCAESHDSPNVLAAMHYTKEDDGLSQPWVGRVYMNPPYGNEIAAWVTKLCQEHEHGGMTEAIALVPARTDTAWFRRLRDYPVCFVAGRLTFIGNDAPAPFPSAVFYLGEDIGRFYRAFGELGDIWQRLEPDNDGVCWAARFAE